MAIPKIYRDPALQRAYLIGYAFALGYAVGQAEKIAQDARQRIARWIKINNNPVPLDKDGNPLSRSGKHIFNSKSRAVKKAHQTDITKMFPVNRDVTTGEEAHKIASVKGLTPDERKSLGFYSTDKNGHNAKINKALRERKEVPPEYRNTYHDIMGVFDKIPGITQPIRVYRGIKSEFVKQRAQGESYKDRGFISASSRHSVAQEYAKQGRTICVMDIPKGTKAISMQGVSRKPSDHEILLPPNTEFTVKSKKKVGAIDYIYLAGVKK